MNQESNKIFAIFKNKDKKEGSTQPDYNISFKVGEKYVNIGGAWIKESKGGKFFSCKLSNGYKDIPGFCIARDAVQTGEAVKEKVEQEIDSSEIPF